MPRIVDVDVIDADPINEATDDLNNNVYVQKEFVGHADDVGAEESDNFVISTRTSHERR